MGKRAREKKLAKVEQFVEEKQLIETRRRERLAPVYVMTRKLAVTLLVTIVLLYVGVLINHHLPGITERLLKRGL
ncbi:MAG TPA: hypothetical protein VLE93_02570 [Candidatus Saccharimonadales bacterium]|nr:hypothetical protein [Candidatus Saccharimonadales bacterium]